MPSRHELRQLIRQRRKQLSTEQQHLAARQLAQRFSHLPFLPDCQHIALYLSNDGELDTWPLIHALWQLGKQLYLPLLHPFTSGHLIFQHFQANTPMRANRFGIPEPDWSCPDLRPVPQLDLICTPLVAFDAKGNRLGMGGGFYDRTLAHYPTRSSDGQPKLIGLAHSCQQVDALPIEPWDVPLPAICTPDAIFLQE
ncbi:5-formyltetrahydrofolate cyclo-ligase [Alkalimonas sp.]|uniref:5-formyltetrahydrofolate cyclo-ligase n=1 Tax=Alkalimonas sp. TaxID=1872453 RepID=UPI002A1D7F3C|nr:5-formyltetrahydrofolate cyclo-ligase [Alkalimonas sp.]